MAIVIFFSAIPTEQITEYSGRQLNSNVWDSQPAVANDGKHLYFVCQQPAWLYGWIS